MTNRWKLKTSSSNILLVLILVKAEWTNGENDNFLDNTNSLDLTKDDSVRDQTSIYVGHDEIAQYFFRSSTNDNSTILSGITKCLDNFQLITCMKMLLLDRINDATGLLEEPSVRDADVRFLNGMLVFKVKNETEDSGPGDISDGLSLDEEITAKVKRIFWGRSLLVNVLPNVQIEIEPARGKASEFMCFSYTVRRNLESTEEDDVDENEGRRRKKRRKCRPGQGGGDGDMDDNMDDNMNDDMNGNGNGGAQASGGGDRSLKKGCGGGNRGGSNGNSNGNRNGNRNRGSRGGGSSGKGKGGKKGGMPMMMMIPPMIMMGLMPFTLASLKSMVMNAVMVTMMALNGAIFMTVRNMVFGPRKGDNVMYVNYGYSKDKEPQTKRPVLIIHSPAAFVKQPPVPKKPFYGPYNAPQNYIQGHGGFSHSYHSGSVDGPWQHSVQNQFHGNGGSPTFYHNENSGNVMNHDTENNYSDNSDSSNQYHVEDGEIVDADVIDTGNLTSMDHYYTVPEVHNQNRKRWQGIRRTYRPKRVKHYLKIRRRTK